MKRIPHRINGRRVATGPRTGKVYDPAIGRVTAEVPYASAAEVDQAVAAATAAAPGWAATSVARRAAVLFRFRERLGERAAELAEVITSEHGKVLGDAAGEVARGLEVAEFACGMPHLQKGEYSSNAASAIDVFSLRQPLGCVAVISPFNFPAMVPLWFVPIAVACGNTVVLKPSEKDPSAAGVIADTFAEAGLPDGVLNVLHGDKEAVDALLGHPDVDAVSFVGSTPIARHVHATASAAGKRVQALGGAKNHMVVAPDADLDTAADAAVSAGFGSAGERCMAISVVVAVDPIGDELVSRIVARIARLKVGNGRRAVDLGPLVTREHLAKVTSYLDAGVAAGAELVVDGRTAVPDGDPDGFWLGPSLFDQVEPDMSVYTDEIFGPVLCVVRVPSLDAALTLVNENRYGNGTAIFTMDGRVARTYQNEVKVGMVGINVPIPVPVAPFSFGGWKDSVFGDLHAYGEDGVRFFTRPKVVTQRWPEPPAGVDLAFTANR
ncbi:CoA-acylating methylmalonate-semialdehyde dehydrogenase [Actinoallomurus acaciae]|uniref:methylmalonate-semialdehyde dehydrogenase (CoA acylating) n=1 Tax=Actinoallomurus acaciae TaxID=502577 RepID=A0ABV5YL11_9ACTN